MNASFRLWVYCVNKLPELGFVALIADHESRKLRGVISLFFGIDASLARPIRASKSEELFAQVTITQLNDAALVFQGGAMNLTPSRNALFQKRSLC